MRKYRMSMSNRTTLQEEVIEKEVYHVLWIFEMIRYHFDFQMKDMAVVSEDIPSREEDKPKEDEDAAPKEEMNDESQNEYNVSKDFGDPFNEKSSKPIQQQPKQSNSLDLFDDFNDFTTAAPISNDFNVGSTNNDFFDSNAKTVPQTKQQNDDGMGDLFDVYAPVQTQNDDDFDLFSMPVQSNVSKE